MNNIICAEELFNNSYSQAAEMVNHPDKVEKLLKRLEKKLLDIPKLGGTLAYVPKMGMLINSWVKHEYTEVPIGTIAAVIGALLYFVLPFDLIPDYIPGIGLLDDAAVVGIALHLVKSDIDEYIQWRQDMGLDDEEQPVVKKTAM